MTLRFPKHALAALSAAAGLLVAATQAQAHAHLVSSTPAANATVAAPSVITLHFSEKLEPKFSGVSVMKSSGPAIAVTSSVPADDPSGLAGALAAPLTPGEYMVMWHVVSGDGHRMTGSFNFTVR